MTDRLRKKRFKKRWHINRVSRNANIKRADKELRFLQAQITKRLGEALEHAILYGGRAKE